MSTADGSLQSLSSLLPAIAVGDLTARMSGEFRGVFAQMRDDANTTASELAPSVGNIQHSAVIKDLIDDAAQRVAEGSALVHSAGKTMGDVVASVQRVTDIMGEISAASKERSAGIEQVNQTITHMDQTTRQMWRWWSKPLPPHAPWNNRPSSSPMRWPSSG